MPIQVTLNNASASSIPRTESIIPGISRWSQTTKREAVYEGLAAVSNPEMRKADNLKFNPSEMIIGASKGMYETDMSYQRVQRDRDWVPVMYTLGALVIFLGVVSFLRRPQ